jgi:hypothetical protein
VKILQRLDARCHQKWIAFYGKTSHYSSSLVDFNLQNHISFNFLPDGLLRVAGLCTLFEETTETRMRRGREGGAPAEVPAFSWENAGTMTVTVSRQQRTILRIIASLMQKTKTETVSCLSAKNSYYRGSSDATALGPNRCIIFRPCWATALMSSGLRNTPRATSIR